MKRTKRKKLMQKIERRTKSTHIFEDSRTHPGGRSEVCEAASGFRVILLFRGHRCLLRFRRDVSPFDDVLASLSWGRGVGLPTAHRTPLLSSVKCCRTWMKAPGFTNRG